ncbi:MAG: hypothetical protein MRZ79_20050 [Bacteroidia bacterium]|nr:hypothetical protein [Bacteroidia bacterium]
MKHLILTLFTTALYLSSFAQAGTYKTYEDYEAGKLKAYKTYATISNTMGDFKISFVNDQKRLVKINLKKEDYWGFQTNPERVFRINEDKEPCVILDKGEITLYGNYTAFTKKGKIFMEKNKYAAQVSKGLNAKMYKLKKENLALLLEGDAEALKKLEETGKSFKALAKFVMDYNDSQK